MSERPQPGVDARVDVVKGDRDGRGLPDRHGRRQD
jgi:hypothetical protein